MHKLKGKGGQASIEYVTLIVASLMLLSILAYNAYTNVMQSRRNLFVSYAEANIKKLGETISTLWQTGAEGDTMTIKLFYYYVDEYSDTVSLMVNATQDVLYYRWDDRSSENIPGFNFSSHALFKMRIRGSTSAGENIRIFNGANNIRITKCREGGSWFINIENVRW